MPQEEIIDSLLRHVAKLRSGEVVDPDSEMGATHWDAIVSNALMLSELRDNPGHGPGVTSVDTSIVGWGAKGLDVDGYCLATGFNAAGVHRTCDPVGPFCNCPSCR